MATLRDLYDLHVSDDFPASLAGRRIEGHCLASLEAQASGCIRAFFEQGGWLGYYGVGVLQECHTDLSEVLESMERAAARRAAMGLPMEAAAPYLVRMHEWTGAILAYISRARPVRRRRAWWQRPVRRWKAAAKG